MNQIEIEEMLRKAIKDKNWELVEKAEKELFCYDVLNILPEYDWKDENSDLRRFFNKPNRTKIDFINLFYYGGTARKQFLEANLERIDEMIDTLYKWLEAYDKEDEE